MEKEALDEGDAFGYGQPTMLLSKISLISLSLLFHSFCHCSMRNTKSATVAMIKHGIGVVIRATHFLNPGQIPVIAMDAPLYALAKLS